MRGHGGTVDYEGHIPTYKHHGFLVTLIPILEALTAGYNVIYFDVDIALVKDPLPYMLTGNHSFFILFAISLHNFNFNFQAQLTS